MKLKEKLIKLLGGYTEREVRVKDFQLNIAKKVNEVPLVDVHAMTELSTAAYHDSDVRTIRKQLMKKMNKHLEDLIVINYNRDEARDVVKLVATLKVVDERGRQDL